MSEFERWSSALPFVSQSQKEKLAEFINLLSEWNSKISLVSRTSFHRVFTAHLADSLWMVEHSKKYFSKTVGDVGTGAGFPGVVLAILHPELRVLLFEKMQKRARYLEDIVSRMDLKNIELHSSFNGDRSLSFVFARAVLPPGELLSWMSSTLLPTQKFALNLGSEPKPFDVPANLVKLGEAVYTLPSEEGQRKIIIYDVVPRGTKMR